MGARRRSAALAALLALAMGLAGCTPGAEPIGPSPSPAASTTPATVTASAAPTPSSAPASASQGPSPASPAPTSAPAAPPAPRAATDPTNPLVVVNKRNPLNPIDFAPQLTAPQVASAAGQSELLNPVTARAVEKMFAAAAAAGAPMALLSGYRSYATQAQTYSGWVARQGPEMADVASARPGYSEHQSGFAFDFADSTGACSLQPCFKDTASAVWAAAHAHEFGFIVRYPWWHHETTGYYYEPWHLRYIGVQAATDMRNRGIATLEEYLGLPGAPSY